jgi:predicted RNA-binding Zn-ribbon protein involved in translation (DUF1610 family)
MADDFKHIEAALEDFIGQNDEDIEIQISYKGEIPDPAALILKCRKCGRELKPDWIKCPTCKTLVALPTCPNCGLELEDDWDECPRCEHVINAAPQSARPAVSGDVEVHKKRAKATQERHPVECPACEKPIVKEAPVEKQPETAADKVVRIRSGFSYTHKEQHGGKGQYAKIEGYIEPCEGGYELINKGVKFPKEFLLGCDKGFQEAIKLEAARQGSPSVCPAANVRCVILDYKYHPVDSSEDSFRLAAIGAFQTAYATLCG